jgi:uncharacterized protein YjbJ (UPF0337 family)
MMGATPDAGCGPAQHERTREVPNKEQVKGRGKNAGGKVEETIGRATGNDEMRSRGKARQARGTVEKVAGDVKDKAKSVADKVRGR